MTSTELWKGKPAADYERLLVPHLFAPWAQDLVGRMQPPENGRVLDVACGTGIVSRVAADYVGPMGHIVGVDMNADMLEVAAAKWREGAARATWHEADVMEMKPPEGPFDVVYCQQGLQFFPDPVAALKVMRKQAKPKGGLAASVWHGPEANPTWQAVVVAAREAIGEEAGARMEVPFAWPDPKALAAAAEKAGWNDVQVMDATLNTSFPDLEELVEAGLRAPPIRDLMAQATQEQKDKMAKTIRKRLQPYVRGGIVITPGRTNILTAHA